MSMKGFYEESANTMLPNLSVSLSSANFLHFLFIIYFYIKLQIFKILFPTSNLKEELQWRISAHYRPNAISTGFKIAFIFIFYP
jgi:hypothetical protein